MNEKFEYQNKESGGEETIEQKIEKLRPTFQKSLEVYLNPEKRLEEGALTIKRKLPDGGIETLEFFVVVEMDEDGPNLAGIDENGDPTSSAPILWKDIIEVEEMTPPKEE